LLLFYEVNIDLSSPPLRPPSQNNISIFLNIYYLQSGFELVSDSWVTILNFSMHVVLFFINEEWEMWLMLFVCVGSLVKHWSWIKIKWIFRNAKDNRWSPISSLSFLSFICLHVCNYYGNKNSYMYVCLSMSLISHWWFLA